MSFVRAGEERNEIKCGDIGWYPCGHRNYCSEDSDGRAKGALPRWRLKRVLEHVNLNISERIGLADLAGVAGLSPMHFAAQFRVATGMRPHDFLLTCRIDAAQELLSRTDYRLIDVAVATGFQTQAHFTTVFKRIVGETPRRWRILRVRHTAHRASRFPSPYEGYERAEAVLLQSQFDG